MIKNQLYIRSIGSIARWMICDEFSNGALSFVTRGSSSVREIPLRFTMLDKLKDKLLLPYVSYTMLDTVNRLFSFRTVASLIRTNHVAIV